MNKIMSWLTVCAVLFSIFSCSNDASSDSRLESFKNYLTNDLGAEYKGQQYFIVGSVYGCRGCLNEVIETLANVKNAGKFTFICVSDNDLYYRKMVEGLPKNVARFHDSHGKVYDFIDELRSAHFLIELTPKSVYCEPITPGNISHIKEKIVLLDER